MTLRCCRPSWNLGESFDMAQQLIKSKYRSVQSYGDVLAITVAKTFAEELQITKGTNVRTYTENGRFIAEKAKE